MKLRHRDLQRLKSVTEAMWLGASQKLREKAAEERAATQRVQDLRRDRDAAIRQISATEEIDVAQIKSTTRWLRWCESERARQNILLARLRAELVMEQDAARASFAKNNALETLLKEATKRG